VIERTHGGARIAGAAGVEVAFEAREQHNIAAKRAIGSAAFTLLRPGTTVFLDAGTTVLQFARHLRMTPLPLSVFTNSLAVAQILVGIGELRVTMLGGQLRPQNLSAVGPIAEAAIDTLWFDQLFLGASAVQQDGTLSTPDAAEASLNARMLRRATRRCVLADSSKFGLTATHRVAGLEAITDLISDPDLSPAWQARLREAGVRVTLAQDVAS
jgi:DeoR family fructose operon transcriptional repressor